MDGVTGILLVLVGPIIAGLGSSLIVAPYRTTAALHEWYVVPPAVHRGMRLRALVARASGIALVVIAIGLTVRAASLMASLS